MVRMPLEIVLLLAFIGFLPIARALPLECNVFSGWQLQECQNIVGDNSLSGGQKQDLYLNLLSGQGLLPPFEFLKEWNAGLEWSTPPSSAKPESNGIIKDAWVEIVSVEKSFFDLNEEKWFAQPSGEVIANKGFSIEYPNGPEPGDCGTNYSHSLPRELFSINLNDSWIGNQKIAGFSSGLGNGFLLDFEASFELEARLQVDHFKEIRHCNRWGECFTSCDYNSTDYRNYSVKPVDEFSLTTKIENPGFKFFLDENSSLKKAIIKIVSPEPLNEFELHLGGNNFFLSESNFDLDATVDDVIFAVKSDKHSRRVDGFLELDYDKSQGQTGIVLGYQNTGDCSYTFLTSFSEKQFPCSETMLTTPTLLVDVNKEAKDFSDTAKVTVSFFDEKREPVQGKQVQIQNKSGVTVLETGENGEAETEISLETTNGVVVAGFAGDEEYAQAQAVKRFPLQNSQAFETTSSLVSVLLAYYFVFLVAKKIFTRGV